MTKTQTHQTPPVCQSESARKGRRMMVSANRSSATHRVRYVETSSGKEDCTVCEISSN
jgi:hypothetical protein